jgi:hypothetical protein
VEVADVVVVHGEDHVAHGVRLHAQQRQAVDGTAQEAALALFAISAVKPVSMT